MGVILQLDPNPVIKASLGINPGGRVHKYFTKRCADYMDKYIPKDSGMLRNNITIFTDKIIYNQLYAHYQYKGISKKGNALNYKKPGTGSYWDIKMWAVDGGTIINETQRYMESGK